MYAAMHTYSGDSVDATIVQTLLGVESAQTVLDGFLLSMLRGSYHSKYFIESPEFQTILRSCLIAGATINIDLILEPLSSSVDEEATTCHVRGALLFYIQQNFIADLCAILDKKIGWISIEPVHWEDSEDDDDFNTKRYKSIKFEYDNQ